GTVRAVDRDDLVARQLHVGVEFGDGRVVEGGDVPGVDARDGFRVQDEAVQVRVVEGDDDRAEHDGKLHGPAVPGIGRSGQFLVVQVLLGGAEVDGLFEELFNTGAGADALVVDADIGLDVVGVGVHPVLEERVGEAGAGPCQGGVEVTTSAGVVPVVAAGACRCEQGNGCQGGKLGTPVAHVVLLLVES